MQLRDVRINDELVHTHERMLTDGFYAEVTLSYDAAIAEEKNGRPFAIDSLRAIQLSKADVLSILSHGRKLFTTDEWKDFLLRSIGLEPTALSERAKLVTLLRMVPFVERNFNLVELGPRGTGKSHLFQQRSYWISGAYAATLSENHDLFLRLLKNNDYKEERMTKGGLYAISTSTTLESNKSLSRFPVLRGKPPTY